MFQVIVPRDHHDFCLVYNYSVPGCTIIIMCIQISEKGKKIRLFDVDAEEEEEEGEAAQQEGGLE